ncbi:Protein of unknown function [Pyronema omphalodes CBS 100304]|uniref:Uncharacterized protein n=1 Tax=Pyronema omphalodes (strain CBS 100304) TaxID=1076935 RepID=U4LKV5_PYROM|nr:Protein of unknown function [Pyronema omphalodes CBS 100304]
MRCITSRKARQAGMPDHRH